MLTYCVVAGAAVVVGVIVGVVLAGVVEPPGMVARTASMAARMLS